MRERGDEHFGRNHFSGIIARTAASLLLIVLDPFPCSSNYAYTATEDLEWSQRVTPSAGFAFPARGATKKPKFVTAGAGRRDWFGLGPLHSNYDDRNPIFRSGIFLRSLSISTRLHSEGTTLREEGSPTFRLGDRLGRCGTLGRGPCKRPGRACVLPSLSVSVFIRLPPPPTPG